MRIILIVVLLLGLCRLLLAADPAKTYAIVLNRPAKVGETYRLSVDGTEKEWLEEYDFAFPGDIRGTETFAMKLDGIVKVIQVDEHNRSIAETLTITKCVQLAKATELPLALPGTVIDASVKDKKVCFAIKGVVVNQQLQKALDIAITLPTDVLTPPRMKFSARPSRNAFGVAGESIPTEWHPTCRKSVYLLRERTLQVKRR